MKLPTEIPPDAFQRIRPLQWTFDLIHGGNLPARQKAPIGPYTWGRFDDDAGQDNMEAIATVFLGNIGVALSGDERRIVREILYVVAHETLHYAFEDLRHVDMTEARLKADHKAIDKALAWVGLNPIIEGAL